MDPVAPTAPRGVAEFRGDAGVAELPDPQRFLALDPEMREFVRTHVRPVGDPEQRLRRLSRVMLDPAYLGIRYDAELTISAPEVFRRGVANCLSFTALFVALAREVGLNARFQDVPVLPNWRLAARTYVVERHVNALVRIRGQEYVVDFRPPNAASWSRARIIEDANAIAQYFGNLGFGPLSEGDLGTAYRLFRRGLEVDPQASSLWVNMGVALGRNGQLQEARDSYRRALELDSRNLSALSNLAGIAAQDGNALEASQLQTRLETYRNSNPYYRFAEGEKALNAGDIPAALQALHEALRLMPEEADFHFALARIYRAGGQTRESRQSLDAALKRASSESQRQRYLAEFGQIGADS